jgi:glycolate oxidase
MPYNKVNENDIKSFIDIVGAGHVFTGDDIHEDYTHDEMMEYGCYTPDAVTEAASTEQVSQIMKYCHGRNIPVTPRGSGTGLCGGCVPIHGGIILSLAKMDSIIEFDEDNLTVTIEPGVLLMDLAAAAIERGLMYPPDPGEKSATVGGNVMTNAGGMRAVKYGVTRDYVMGMTAVLPNGEVAQLGGKVAKNSSGYDLKNIIVGSEGTLAVVTELILKLVPLPPYILSLLVPFRELDECIETVPKIIQSKIVPTAIEFMEREVIVAAEEYLGHTFPDKTSDAYLLLTFDGNSQGELDDAYQKAAEICLANGAIDVFISDTQERQDSIWKARGAFLEAINTSTPSMDECDVVVPRNRIADYVKYISALQGRYDLRIPSFGHAGDGNLHIYLCKDNLDDNTWEEKRAEIMDIMYKKAQEMGGKVSGEHGIGHAKAGYLKDSADKASIKIMQGIKKVFDSDNILNPGKVVG